MSTHPSPGVINLNCLWCVGKSAITAPNREISLLLMQLSDKQFLFQTIRMVMSVSITIHFLTLESFFSFTRAVSSGDLCLTTNRD